VFFEAPHRIAETLQALAEVFGAERRAAVARELTKLHETIYRGTLAELIERSRSDENFQRGEITLVIEGAKTSNVEFDETLLRKTLTLLLKELPTGKAASIAAQLTGAKRNDAYALALRISKRPDEDSAE
jgi:16S rRNA (cytidine1402-2'-O)-methyltransferase